MHAPPGAVRHRQPGPALDYVLNRYVVHPTTWGDGLLPVRAVPGDWTAEVASLRSSPSPIVTPRVSARVAWLLLVATLLHVSRYEVMYYGVSESKQNKKQ